MMQSQDSFVVDQVKIFDGYEFIDTGYVTVRNGTVVEVARGQPDGPYEQDIPIISRPHHTLIPGLIDAHIHAVRGNIESIEQSLRFGVTTVCDMHNEVKDIIQLKKLTSSFPNKAKYSDYKYAGLGATIEGGWPIPILKDEFESVPDGEAILDTLISAWPNLKTGDGAGPFVRQQVTEHGASYIKMFHELGDTLGMDIPSPTMDVQKSVVEAAHKAGVIAVGHALSYNGALALLQAGVDGLTHVFLDRPPNDEFITLMLSRKIHCSPTLSLCASQTAERQEWQKQFREDPLAQRMLMRKSPDRPHGLASAQRSKATVQNAYETTKKMYQAGVPIIAGSDSAGRGFGVPFGLGMHIEMHLFAHEIGMLPEDVLKSSTFHHGTSVWIF
ncbi:hypothetical protein F5883DRAFT_569782 [Diaporthe sp. PMI_573]|nr:hypothetical protein F5883DRAFT_569782 [Diaporthaceae sp. PMI_573]